MKRVYTLYRVSTKKQVDYSTGQNDASNEMEKNDIPLQYQTCHEFAERQGDWEIVKEFYEKGVSGYKVSANDRDSIQDLKEAALKKEFDVLLVFLFDRIGRIDSETPFVVEWFVKNGIEVWSALEGQQQFEQHVDKLINYIRFWQASGESQKTSLRIKEKHRQMKLLGAYTGGPLSIGYTTVLSEIHFNRKHEPIKMYTKDIEQEDMVNIIKYETLVNGRGSYQVADILNKKGYRTINGNKFTASSINRFLRNPLPYGYTQSGETSEALEKLAYFTQDDRIKLIEMLEQRKAKDEDKRRIARMAKGQAMLSGNIFCAHCGGRISTTHHLDHYIRKDGTEYRKDTLKYRCYNKCKKLCDCPGQTSYMAERIDTAVDQIIKQILGNLQGSPNQEKLKEMLKRQTSSNKAKLKKLNRDIEKNNKRLDALQIEIADALVGDSAYSATDLSNAIQVLKSKISAQRIEQEELEKAIMERQKDIESVMPAYREFTTWAEQYDKATLEQRKLISCKLFDKIELSKDYKITITLNMTYKQFYTEWLQDTIEAIAV